MKKRISLMAFMVIIVTTIAVAQGGYQMPAPEERTKNVMERLSVLKLDKEQTIKTDSIFTNFFRAQVKKREEMRAGGSVDREAMRAEMIKMNTDRDDKLKQVFTEEQFKKFKEEVEPSMRPRRGNGGGQQ